MRFRCKKVPHQGGVNRVRAMLQRPGVVAAWGDSGVVSVYDLAALYEEIAADASPEQSSSVVRKVPPRHTCKHREEGYALDWSPAEEGRLLSGDCAGTIQLSEPGAGGRWRVEREAFHGHGGSVEDLQWSPSEPSVFASCGVDGTVRVWDARQRMGPAITVQAHEQDVNVISWNRLTSCMLASGSDDGSFKIWDLRNFQAAGSHVAHLTYHRGPVTSIEWCPHDEAMLATASEDNQLAVWDLSVERDAEEEERERLQQQTEVRQADEIPPQLMFLHMGQQDMKELHWHPQVPGMLISTARDFNVFKPTNLDSDHGRMALE